MKKLYSKSSEHPLVTLITVLGGIIGIFIFVSGIENLPDLYKKWFISNMYDDFEEAKYDGRINTTLWEIGDNPRGEATQLDGVLVLQTNLEKKDGNFGLFPTNPRNVSFRDFKFMEAKLRLDSREAGNGSFLKIQAATFVDQEFWWIECKLENNSRTNTDMSCNLHEGNFQPDDTPIYAYETEHFALSYDTWYTIRFVSDPLTGAVSFYLDNRLIGKSTFSDVETLRNFSSFVLQIGSWISAEDSFLGYVDDVKIGIEK